MVAEQICFSILICFTFIFHELDTKAIRSTVPAYNNKYPITPVQRKDGNLIFRFAIITDMDKMSKIGDTFVSYLRKGTLTVDDKFTKVSVRMDEDEIKLTSDFNENGRGMELSDLVTFNGKLYTCDDRTGEVYELIDGATRVEKFVQLKYWGNNKGFKCEWLAVKNQLLYIGSTGKEWVDDGVIKNRDGQIVKTVDINKKITSRNWTKRYNALRKKTGYSFPGYLIHESAVWSEIQRKWFFLPRKASKEIFDDSADETKCSNIMITADENFSNIGYRTIGELDRQFGFSAFRFISGSNDKSFVALKTKEIGKDLETILYAYDIQGKTLMAEPVKLGNKKYEGIEFI